MNSKVLRNIYANERSNEFTKRHNISPMQLAVKCSLLCERLFLQISESAPQDELWGCGDE
jgi:hypothetical protein